MKIMAHLNHFIVLHTLGILMGLKMFIILSIIVKVIAQKNEVLPEK